MRYLPISIFVLLMSCGSYPKKNGFQEMEPSQSTIFNPYFSDTAKDYVYKADIHIKEKKFSGLFVIKKLGTKHHRIVFTTQMGGKIFDFTFIKGHFKVNHILDEINKKIIIGFLQNDFRTLLTEQAPLQKNYRLDKRSIFETEINKRKHLYLSSNNQLEQILVVTPLGKEKVGFLFSEISDNIARQIQISHKGIGLTLFLKAI